VTCPLSLLRTNSRCRELERSADNNAPAACSRLPTVTLSPPPTRFRSVNFASENFNFCIGAKAADYLKTIFAQLFEVMEKQMGAADIMRNVLNSLRDGIGQVFNPFSTMMNKFWNKFKQMGALASRIFQQIYMAMKKAAGNRWLQYIWQFHCRHQ
jgi:hypothetical protein